MRRRRREKKNKFNHSFCSRYVCVCGLEREYYKQQPLFNKYKHKYDDDKCKYIFIINYKRI